MNTGGPAFPIFTEDGELHMGLTIRDWFAGQAIVGFVARPELYHHFVSPVYAEPNVCVSVVSQFAYRMADAMLAEREKGGNQ
jgi:hypothetical protein